MNKKHQTREQIESDWKKGLVYLPDVYYEIKAEAHKLGWLRWDEERKQWFTKTTFFMSFWQFILNDAFKVLIELSGQSKLLGKEFTDDLILDQERVRLNQVFKQEHEAAVTSLEQRHRKFRETGSFDEEFTL
jgi:hypothetical protein